MTYSTPLNGKLDQTLNKIPGFIGQITSGIDGARNVYVRNSYAYVTSNLDQSLRIIDISDPYIPVIIGALGGLENLTGIYISGNYAYVVSDSGNNSIYIIDISDPTTPSEISNLDVGTFTDLTNIIVSGKYAYITAENLTTGGLIIVDISNPVSPFIKGSLSTITNAYGIDIVGKYVYIACSDSQLNIVDVSDPSTPVVSANITDITNIHGARGISVRGKYAFVTGYNSNTFSVYDISDPNGVPVFVTSKANVDGGLDLEVVGKYAYISGSNKITRIDISLPLPSGPDALEEAGFIYTSISQRIYIDGGYAYAVSADNTIAFTVIDLQGAYLPSLQSGSLKTDLLSVTSNSQFTGPVSITSGLNVSNGICVQNSITADSLVLSGDGNVFQTSLSSSTAATEHINYILPPSIGSAGTLLSDASGDGVLSWTSIAEPSGTTQGNIQLRDTIGTGFEATEDFTFLDSTKKFTVDNTSNTLTPIGSITTGITGIKNMVIRDNLVYITGDTTSSIYVVDISDPTTPVVISNNVISPSAAFDIKLVGNYAFVTSFSGGSGFSILDISDPTNITLISKMSSGTYYIEISGQYAYVSRTGDNYIDIYDISNPSSISSPVSSITGLSNGNSGMSIQGNTLFIAGYYDNNINVYDITDPLNASKIGITFSDAGLSDVQQIITRGNYLYVSCRGGDIFLILDITDPGNMTKVTTNYTPTDLSGGYSLEISGNFIYLITYGDNQNASPTNDGAIVKLDIRDPSNVIEISRNQSVNYNVNNQFDAYGCVTVNDKYIIVGRNSGGGGIDIYYTGTSDIININSGHIKATNLFVQDIRIRNNAMFDSGATVAGGVSITGPLNVAGGITGELLLKSANAGSISTVGTTDNMNFVGISTDNSSMSSPRSVVISGNYAYVASNGNDRLVTFDISDPTKPIPSGYIYSISMNGATDLFVSGNYAYVVGENTSSLQIIDITDPTNPIKPATGSNGAVVITGVESGLDCQGVIIDGNYAYIACKATEQLAIIDVSDPASPVNVIGGQITITGNGYHLAKSGNFVYVTCDVGTLPGISVINVTDPAAPTLENTITTSPITEPRRIAISGNYAYVADKGNHFIVIDITTPSSADVVGSIKNNQTYLGDATGVAIDGNYAYVASESSKSLAKINITTPTSPYLVNYKSNDQFSNAVSVGVSNNFVYMLSTNSNTLSTFTVDNSIYEVISGKQYTREMNVKTSSFIDLSSSNKINIEAPILSLGYNLTLPTTSGTANQVLSTGSTPGTMEWVTSAAGGSEAGGSDTQIQFNNSTAFAGSADLTWDGSNIATSGGLKLKESAGDNTHYITLQAPASLDSDISLTFPANTGSASEFLQTDGSGNLVWSAASGGSSSSEFVSAPGEVIVDIQTISESSIALSNIAWSPTLSIFVIVPYGTVSFSSPDGINWTERTAINASWYGLIWAPAPLSKFVAIAVSGTNRIMHSSDGITWSQATNAPSLDPWRSIGYSPTLGSGSGRLVAVTSSADTFMYSDDGGDTWITSGTTTPTGGVKSSSEPLWISEINGGSGAFICAGSNSDKIYKSVDGLVWTESVFAGGNFGASGNKSVAWSPTLSKIVIICNSLKNVIYSTDEGLTWSDTNVTNTTDATWQSIIWSTLESKFIAVSISAGSCIMVSSDGETWEDPVDTELLSGIAESVSLEKLVACGKFSKVISFGPTIKYKGNITAENLKTDNDLILKNINIKARNNITPFNLTLPSTVGSKGNILKTSGAGLLSWENDKLQTSLKSTLEYFTSADESTSWYGIDYSPTLGIFVAVGVGTDKIMYSYYGETWETAALDLTGLSAINQSWSFIKWVPEPLNKFVICAQNGGTVNNDRIAYSSDGLTWLNITSLAPDFNSVTPSSFKSIVYSVELDKVLVGSSVNEIAVFSLTGDISTNSWTLNNVSSSSYGGTYVPELKIFFIPFLSSTNAIFSYTGTSNWTTVKISDSSVAWYDAAWSPELGVMCVCSSGLVNITRSSGDILDPDSWTEQSTGLGSMYTISWVPELSLFVGVGINVQTSPDGLVWTQITFDNVGWAHVYSPEHGKLMITSATGTNRISSIKSAVKNMGNFETKTLSLQDLKSGNTISIETPDLSSDSSYKLTLPVDTGTVSQVLSTDGSGVLNWITPSVPASGSNTQIQFNGNTAFSGSSDLTWNNTDKILTTNKIEQTSNKFYIASTVTGATNAHGIAINGDYMYVVSPTTNTLYIYNTKPLEDSVPVLVGSLTDNTNLDGAIKVLHNGVGLFVGGSVDGATSGFMTAIDIRNPVSPLVISSQSHGSVEGLAGMKQIGGSYIIATSVMSGEHITYDISDPSDMITARYLNAGHYGYYGVETSGDKLFMVGNGTITSYHTTYAGGIIQHLVLGDLTVSGLSEARALAIRGNYAFIGSYNLTTQANGISVVDISKPYSMVKVGSTFTAGNTLGTITDMIISGKYLYVISEQNDNLDRIDISNPESLVLSGTLSGFSNPTNMVLSGRYLYITNKSTNAVSKVNIGAAEIPQLSTGHIDTTSIKVKDIDVAGNLNVTSGISTYGSITSKGTISSTESFKVKSKLMYYGSTSGVITTIAPATGTSYTMTLPPNMGNAGATLVTDGSGNSTWSEVGSDTQLTSITTDVTINKYAGRITCFNTSTVQSNNSVNFTFYNSFITNSSVLLVSLSTTSSGVENIFARVRNQQNGFCLIDICNSDGTDAVDYQYFISFHVIN